jgi:hypothetical protein
VGAIQDGIPSWFVGDTTFCGQTGPSVDASAVYMTAISGNEAYLTALEPGRRCVADPTLLCTRDINDGIFRGIGTAGRAPELARLGLPLFLPFVGTRSCTIPVGQAAARVCAVDAASMCKASKARIAPTVVFWWPVAGGKTASHTWRVLLENYNVVSVTQQGSFRHNSGGNSARGSWPGSPSPCVARPGLSSGPGAVPRRLTALNCLSRVRTDGESTARS